MPQNRIISITPNKKVAGQRECDGIREKSHKAR